MRDIGKRIERLEEVLGALDCICGAAPAIEILIIEDGWDEERIQLAEEAKRIACPVHGAQRTPVLRLVGSDVYG